MEDNCASCPLLVMTELPTGESKVDLRSTTSAIKRGRLAGTASSGIPSERFV